MDDVTTMANMTTPANVPSEEGEQPYSPASLAIISLIMGVIISVTIVANFLVILAYSRVSQIRDKVGNLLILNLAVTDFMVGVFSLTFNFVWLLRGFWPLGEVICKLWLVLDYTICWMSMITLVLISWDRYCLVSMGLKYKTYQTKKRVGLILTVAWTVVLILVTLIAFAWSPISGESNIDYDRMCTMEFIVLNYAPLAINLIPFGILLVCIVILNSYVYANIYQRSKVRLSRLGKVEVKYTTTKPNGKANGSPSFSSNMTITTERLSGNTPEEIEAAEATTLNTLERGEDVADKERITLARHRKAAIVLGILTGVFVVSWLPYITTTVIYAKCMDCVSATAWEVTEVLGWCNSTINPFIYAATNLQFRKILQRYLRVDRWWCGSKRS
nr:probable G-protein coupled receptor No18 [Lytechinus pictus]